MVQLDKLDNSAFTVYTVYSATLGVCDTHSDRGGGGLKSEKNQGGSIKGVYRNNSRAGQASSPTIQKDTL